MSKLLIIYLFHLLLVFPYLAYVGWKLDQPAYPDLQQHGQLLKFVAFAGAVYQAILLWQHIQLIYSV